MKKRLFAGLLVLVLFLMTGCAKKASFSFRGGITFGMSVNEVIAIEGEPMWKSLSTDEGEFPWELERADENCSSYLAYFDRTVSGEESLLFYYLDKSDKVMLCASLVRNREQDEHALEENLTDLYGASVGDATEDFCTIANFLGNSFNDAMGVDFEISSKRVKNNGTVLHLVDDSQSAVIYYDASYITPQGNQ